MSKTYGVTVVCLAYNHEKYISQTLEGFVGQRTTFPYRVIVHDDASTDDTAEVIRRYEERYPDLILGIYQKENMHSAKRSIYGEFILPNIDSEYVALCEGDDYWIDETKLQRQYDALEGHPSCAMCVHRVQEVRENGQPNGTMYPSFELEEGVVSGRRFIELSQNYSFHTSSYFFCAEEFKKYIQAPPEFRRVSEVGDVCYMLYFGQLGDVYYLNETMSCYRRGVPTSWSVGLGNPHNTEKFLKYLESMIQVMEKFDEFTHHRYRDIMERRIAFYTYRKLLLEESARGFLRSGERRRVRSLPPKNKVLLYASALFPKTMKRIYLDQDDKRRKRQF